MTGIGYVDSLGVESSLMTGLGFMPFWAATVSKKEAVTRLPELLTKLTKGRECRLLEMLARSWSLNSLSLEFSTFSRKLDQVLA